MDFSGKVVKLIAIDSDIRQLKKAQNELVRKNDMINSSIKYAKTIQNAIFPSVDLINSYFRNFIIYRPKDIVSGDFYWFGEIQEESGNSFVAAVVDCTGHGVPGAFMSMIGSRILNEIVFEKKVSSPAHILDLLNQSIVKALRQGETDNQDGMDICLCKIKKTPRNSFEICFAGAKRDFVWISGETRKLDVLKADRISIGGTSKSKNHINFTEKKIELKSKDRIYLFSDGFADQNNKNREKFGVQSLYEILSNYESIEIQKEILEYALSTWQGSEIQRDDITFIGIEL
jgi:serine phosphatase RsbU (regulator of sigma subunit)